MQRMEAIVEKQKNTILVKSPLVGFVYDVVPQNAMLVPGSIIAKIKVLASNYTLHLPSHISGIVKTRPSNKIIASSYEQVLLELSNEKMAKIDDIKEQKVKQSQNIIAAPTDGMFYRKPSPDAPEYVQVGEVIKKGQIVGLIEVMKTFNQVFFEAEEAILSEICVADASEVKKGQALFILKAKNG